MQPNLSVENLPDSNTVPWVRKEVSGTVGQLGESPTEVRPWDFSSMSYCAYCHMEIAFLVLDYLAGGQAWFHIEHGYRMCSDEWGVYAEPEDPFVTLVRESLDG